MVGETQVGTERTGHCHNFSLHSCHWNRPAATHMPLSHDDDDDSFLPIGTGSSAGDESDSPIDSTIFSLPLFDPDTSAAAYGPAGGLGLAAADADMNKWKPTQALLPLLLQPGLFNLAASLSIKVVKKTLYTCIVPQTCRGVRCDN